MAKTKIHGVTIELNGDASGLISELKSVDSSLKGTQASLRDVNKLLKLDPTNVELLTQKQGYLKSAIEETENKLEKEKAALRALNEANQTDEVTEDQKALSREVVETENKLKNLKKEYDDFGSVGQQVLKAQGEKLKELGEKLVDIGKKWTTHITLPIAAAATFAVKAASDYEENLNKVDVAFGKSAEAVKQWAKTATESFGLSESSALEASALFGDMATSMGVTDAQAAQMSTTLTGLAGDLASFKNISTDQAMNALKAVFTGETEALKNLGVVMTQTNLEDFAARQGLVYSAMSETEKVMLRYEFVLDRTQNAQGDYARTSDGTANSLRTLKEELNNLAVAFGEVLLPIITPIVQALTKIVKAIRDLPGPIKTLIVVVGLIVAAIGPLLMGIGFVMTALGGLAASAGTASAAMGVLSTAMSAVMPIVAAIAAVFAGLSFGKMVAEQMKEVEDSEKEMDEATREMVKSTDSRFQQWYRNYLREAKNMEKTSEDFSRKITIIWDAATETIKWCFDTSIAGYVYNGMTSLMADMAEKVRERLGEAADAFREKFQEMEDVVDEKRNEIAEKFAKGVGEMAEAAKQRMSEMATDIKSKVQEIAEAMRSVQMSTGYTGYGYNSLLLSGISWHADAMNDGIIMRSPTIFGASNGKLQGAGEAGAEVLVGYNSLRGMIQSAVAGASGSVSINVYAQPGQDASQIAREVEKQFVLWQRQRRVAMV